MTRFIEMVKEKNTGKSQNYFNLGIFHSNNTFV